MHTDAALHILYPALALIGHTLVILVYMYLRRLPAMAKSGRDLAEFRDTPALLDTLPPAAVYAAGNLRNLSEIPVLFYALCLITALLGAGDGAAVMLAWAYVALRVLHSVVQCGYNKIEHRFAAFAASCLVLIGLYAKLVFALIA